MANPEGLAHHFGANMRRVRKRAGMSQEALGERAGLHRTEVGLLERGARVPRIDTLLKLAGGLDVNAAVLLEGIDWTEGETKTTPGAFTFLAQSGPEQAQSGRAIG